MDRNVGILSRECVLIKIRKKMLIFLASRVLVDIEIRYRNTSSRIAQIVIDGGQGDAREFAKHTLYATAR